MDFVEVDIPDPANAGLVETLDVPHVPLLLDTGGDPVLVATDRGGWPAAIPGSNFPLDVEARAYQGATQDLSIEPWAERAAKNL